MKFKFLFFIAAFASVSAFAQLENGGSLKFFLGIPSDNYGGDTDWPDTDMGLLFGGQVGNNWYFYNENPVGVGLAVNWFDFSLSSSEVGDYTNRIYNVGLLEFGPLVSVEVGRDMAVDVQYNLRPTFLVHTLLDSDIEGDTGFGFGFTHAVGAAFRYSKVSLGFEYNFGTMSDFTMNPSAEGAPDYKYDLVTSNTRIVLGFHF